MIELVFERDRKRFVNNIALLKKEAELRKRRGEITTPREELRQLYTRKNALTLELDKINMRIRAIEISTPWELRRP